MDLIPRSDSTESEQMAQTLTGLSAASAEDAIARLTQVLARASEPSVSGAGAERLDLALVHAFGSSIDPDLWLSQLDVDELGALLERCVSRLAGKACTETSKRAVLELLDLLRRPALLTRIEPLDQDRWAERFLAGIEATALTVGVLFRQRAEKLGSRVLFRYRLDGRGRNLTWRRARSRVELIARALLALDDGADPQPIALLSENRIELALIDLACLSSGLFNVLVPANSTDADVRYILGHSKAHTVIVSTRKQLSKVIAAREELPHLEHIIVLDLLERKPAGVLTWEELLSLANRTAAEVPEQRGLAVRPGTNATVMYTSGTTGTPKGILFTQRSLVFKRFARALALPSIGEDDVFLCFLPLFHTFGRFLEMLGCIFWGATYCFLDNPSPRALTSGMRRYQPTVFISVPKKWIQLHEMITTRADPVTSSDDELRSTTETVTGGKLRWGLSAAGHLDSDVFRFFQRQGIQLLSGFGMTEATGGITMTPVDGYRDNSLGSALPGIETAIAEDGELLVRGPYLMAGYLDPPDDEPSFDTDGWFHTGDLMKVDRDGHHRLVDRKKEIYKNIKGETIAPQRIENLFRDLEAVGRVFLVGDHREFNTVLLWPNPNYSGFDFEAASDSEIRDHFRSLVVSVNKFLAPYERIVDFAVIDRDLDPERGELTEKGTPRRTTVVRNFADTIRLLYRRVNLEVGDVELTLPNWLFQRLGLTAQDIRIGDGTLVLPSRGSSLAVERHSDDLVQIGSCYYRHPKGAVNLGALLYSPRLWVGNEQLVDFIDLEANDRRRPGRTEEGIRWEGRATPYRVTEQDKDALGAAARSSHHDLLHLDLAARMLASEERTQALAAVQLLEQVLDEEESFLASPARRVLGRAAMAGSLDVRRIAFRVLAANEHDSRFQETLRLFLTPDSPLLDEATRDALCSQGLSRSRLAAFQELAREICFAQDKGSEYDELAGALLALLAAYGAAHPVCYRPMRTFLVRANLLSPNDHVRELAAAAILTLRNGFRGWLGPATRIAVDPETGQEYQWNDVVEFNDDVPPADRPRLLAAVRDTAILREAVFLFSKGALIRLSDIPPGGVWIRLLGERHGKSVYRVTVQTRYQGAYDVAINVNHKMTDYEVLEEIHWLIVSGASKAGPPLVEDFGGYWAEHGMWSEEFIPGETLSRSMLRLSKRADEGQRLNDRWPFLAWTALSACVDFWQRSGRRWELDDPGLHNIVVPTDDYMTGVRIVSVSARRPHTGLDTMIRALHEKFLDPAVEAYPTLGERVGWDVIFSSILEILGEDEGLEQLGQLLEGKDDAGDEPMLKALSSFLEIVKMRGFLPRRLFFAAKRYRRWENLGEEPTHQARARTMREFYDTYGLTVLEQEYPETRVRFFRETVFREAGKALADGLEEMIARLRSGELIGDELIDAVADLRSRLELDADEDYFLTRLSFPYLRPEDRADFVHSHLGDQQSEMVVNVEDLDGNRFRVRHALNPKEVERLHGLFRAAKLDVRFRLEHRYLVAINDRGQILGGIFYETEEDGRSAHLEKIVVADPYRRKGVADRLMKELFNRLRSAGVQTVTTGFFRPQYFYGYGFSIEKRYAGLVKDLIEEEQTTESNRGEAV
jgi:long-chain acyl-CoA synthetase